MDNPTITVRTISRREFKLLAKRAAPVSPEFSHFQPGSLLLVKPKRKPKELSPGVYRVEYQFLVKRQK